VLGLDLRVGGHYRAEFGPPGDIDLGGRTEVVVTDQGIGAEVHRGGWTWALGQLARVLAR